MADIRKMLEELGFHSADFSAQYKDSIGRTLPCYHLPKRECIILVSGYNVHMRARIIDRWQELEARKAGAEKSAAAFIDHPKNGAVEGSLKFSRRTAWVEDAGWADTRLSVRSVRQAPFASM